jgi:hypothetical protein
MYKVGLNNFDGEVMDEIGSYVDIEDGLVDLFKRTKHTLLYDNKNYDPDLLTRACLYDIDDEFSYVVLTINGQWVDRDKFMGKEDGKRYQSISMPSGDILRGNTLEEFSDLNSALTGMQRRIKGFIENDEPTQERLVDVKSKEDLFYFVTFEDS